MEKNRESLPLDRKVTSRDVARVAGVSQSTVSRVFSDVSSVKPELKERVYRAAEEIGYRPNLVARGMISGKTNVIGLVVGDSLGPFYNRIINKFAEAIQKMGKQCLIFKVPRQDQAWKNCRKSFTVSGGSCDRNCFCYDENDGGSNLGK